MPKLALAAFIADVEWGRGKMARIGKASGRPAQSGGSRTLLSLYEAARKEVFADPAAAVRKYQPSWEFSLPTTARRSTRHR